MQAPEGVALATADADGRPSVRMVLLRGFDEQGFRFWDTATAATLTVVLLALLGALAGLQFGVLGRRVHYR